MNWKRILAGGLVAGLVTDLGEFAIEPLMGSQMEPFFRRLGLPVPGESAMAVLAGMALLLGVVSIWLYAAIRPRYGAGAHTAVIAGIVVWVLSCLFPNASMLVFGLIPDARTFWLWTLWPLVESVVATLAGGWVYREGARVVPAGASARA